MKNYYQILGLRNCVPLDQIKKAYRSLALHHHPDRGGDQEKMKEINEAYDFMVKNKDSYDENFKPRRPQVATNGFTIIVGGWTVSTGSNQYSATWSS